MVPPWRPTHDTTELILRHLHLLDDGSLPFFVLMTLVAEGAKFRLKTLQVLEMVLVPGVT